MINQDVFTEYFTKITNVTNLHNISIMLYTESIYIFILGSVVLLIGMLGAIMLTLQKQQRTRRQDYYNQNLKNLTRAIKIVK
jgi:NADH:ubiquinone oxidoreductase subunit 6 (subunit J)